MAGTPINLTNQFLIAMPSLREGSFAGSVIYLWRERLPLGWGVFAAILAALAISAVHSSAFFVAYLILFPAMALWLPGVLGQ